MRKSSRFDLRLFLRTTPWSLSVRGQHEEGPHLFQRYGWHCPLDIAAQRVASCAIASLQALSTINNNAHWLHLHLRALLHFRKRCIRLLAATVDSIRLADIQRQPSTLLPSFLLLLLLLPIHFF